MNGKSALGSESEASSYPGRMRNSIRLKYAEKEKENAPTPKKTHKNVKM